MTDLARTARRRRFLEACDLVLITLALGAVLLLAAAWVES